MSRRIDRLYDEAMAEAKESQKALVMRMRELRKRHSGLSEEAMRAVFGGDAEVRSLSRKTDEAWAVVNTRLNQLKDTKEIAHSLV
jgi:hypothetical protein